MAMMVAVNPTLFMEMMALARYLCSLIRRLSTSFQLRRCPHASKANSRSTSGIVFF